MDNNYPVITACRMCIDVAFLNVNMNKTSMLKVQICAWCINV